MQNSFQYFRDDQLRRWVIGLLPLYVCIVGADVLINGAGSWWLRWLTQSSSIVLFYFTINSLAVFSATPMWMLLVGKRLPMNGKKLALGSAVSGLALLLVCRHWEPAASHLAASHLGKNVIFDMLVPLVPLGLFAVSLALRQTLHAHFRRQPKPQWVTEWFWLVAFIFLMSNSLSIMLSISRVVFPLTFDWYLYHIDAAFGGLAQAVVMAHQVHPVWQTLVEMVYNVLPVLFYLILGMGFREGKTHSLHLWRTFFVPFGAALLCYTWLHATGPQYSFFNLPFPFDPAPALDRVPLEMQAVPPAPRNAMPSMHLTGALLLWMLALGLRSRLLIAGMAAFVVITAWATLALGEHYVIDLVVALPFAAWLGSGLIAPPGWERRTARERALWVLSGATFVAWMLLLRVAAQWLAEHLWFVRAFSVWSVGVAVALFAVYARVARRSAGAETELEAAARARAAALQTAGEAAIGTTQQSAWSFKTLLPEQIRAGGGWMVGMFFVSGFAGLVYEVVYAKSLGVTFGGTALASNTVLATYMGGMALGAWLGGRLAERSHQPLRLYALCEAGIGLYALLTPLLFKGIAVVYVALALNHAPDAPLLTVLRVGLGVAVLGLPTVLMGATLPLVFKKLKQMGVSSERAIAPLYAANVLGAATGALVGGYALLPLLGRNGATYMAALIGLLVALFVLEKLKQPQWTEGAEAVASGTERAAEMATQTQEAASSAQTWVPRRVGLAAVIVLTVGGAVTLALKVLNMHMLAMVAGNSVYAFALMLATFLLGLGAGSAAGERLLARVPRGTLVVYAQAGLAVAVVLSGFVWDGLANYLGSFGDAQIRYGVRLSFGARELLRGVVCAIAMMPPAFFIGMSYPAAMGIAADWMGGKQPTRGLGAASGMNTLGNIAGVLLTGFWLLPAYGSNTIYMLLAMVAVVLAALMLFAEHESAAPAHTMPRWLRVAPVALAALLLPFFPQQWDSTALSRGGNVYFFEQNWGDVIDQSESVEGGFTSVARSKLDPNQPDAPRVLTLLTNGKFQGNNARGDEMVAQASVALVPLLHTAQRDNALVIGYGTGMSAHVLHDAGYKRLDIVELSQDIIRLADRHFSDINGSVSRQAGVHIYLTDGRNYLLTQEQQYDLISMEISSIWFAGAANLYNAEFYALARKRLRTEGVLQQWVQLHHMREIDLLYVIATVRSQFRYVRLYVAGGQGIIVATNSEQAANSADARAALAEHPNAYGLTPEQLAGSQVLSPAQVDSIIARLDPQQRWMLSTDNNLYLEYATPKGNALLDSSAEKSVAFLLNVAAGGDAAQSLPQAQQPASAPSQ